MCTFLEVLKFIFSSFWIWLGTVILVGVLSEGLGGIFRIYYHKK